MLWLIYLDWIIGNQKLFVIIYFVVYLNEKEKFFKIPKQNYLIEKSAKEFFISLEEM